MLERVKRDEIDDAGGQRQPDRLDHGDFQVAQARHQREEPFQRHRANKGYKGLRCNTKDFAFTMTFTFGR